MIKLSRCVVITFIKHCCLAFFFLIIIRHSSPPTSVVAVTKTTTSTMTPETHDDSGDNNGDSIDEECPTTIKEKDTSKQYLFIVRHGDRWDYSTPEVCKKIFWILMLSFLFLIVVPARFLCHSCFVLFARENA